MRTGIARGGWGPAALTLLGVLSLFLVGCGGIAGGTDSGEDTRDLWVQRFSVPNFSGILLDESVNLVFSERIKPTSLNHDSIRMRTGDQGGEAPRGVFVKGIFLIDVEEYGTRIVIDPDQIGPGLLKNIQQNGRVDKVPPEIRYDLGANSPLNGNRQVLFNHTFGTMVTFVPEIPTRPDLSDTGYVPGATYSVTVPAFPVLNTVESVGGDPVLPREGRVFVSTFTCVPSTSPTLFLGGENVGSPRVINTDPANGEPLVPSDARIYLRFSQALDPRYITTDNFFLEISSVPGRPQIPVSLFLRQTRLGIVEVVMTPLQDLPDEQFLEVTISGGVLDLLRTPITPYVFSFSTGDTGQPAEDVLETFTSNSKEDTRVTTANWNGTKPFVGATPGALTAVFAPFAGNGTDGAFAPLVGETTILDTESVDAGTGAVSQKFYNFETVNIPIGATVIGQGRYGLVMRCQQYMEIHGDLIASGGMGGTGQTSVVGGTDPTGGQGGLGGPGGYAGGDGGMATIGSGGNFDGVDGFGPGGGNGGGSGDQEAWTDQTQPPPPEAVREGGGGGGHSIAGADADISNYKGTGGGRGGGTYGEPDFSDAPLVPPVVGVPSFTQGHGGSGGGGGGGEDDHPNPTGNPPYLGDGLPGAEDEGGGGGGGGGGALQLAAYGYILVKGRIEANGGDGGGTFNESTGGLGQGAPGGAGAGGSIWIQSFNQVDLDALARIEALGGVGGIGNWDDREAVKGGDAGDGYIRIEDSDGSIIVPDTVVPSTEDTVGMFSPPLDLDSEALSLWYNQRIPTPNYDAPEFDLDINGGIIRIDIQGSREDVTVPGDQPVDPDLDPERLYTTDWVELYDSRNDPPVYDGAIDKMDNYQYVRFRVLFSVDPIHTFVDPLPIIHQIRIPLLDKPDTD